MNKQSNNYINIHISLRLHILIMLSLIIRIYFFWMMYLWISIVVLSKPLFVIFIYICKILFKYLHQIVKTHRFYNCFKIQQIDLLSKTIGIQSQSLKKNILALSTIFYNIIAISSQNFKKIKCNFVPPQWMCQTKLSGLCCCWCTFLQSRQFFGTMDNFLVKWTFFCQGGHFVFLQSWHLCSENGQWSWLTFCKKTLFLYFDNKMLSKKQNYETQSSLQWIMMYK